MLFGLSILYFAVFLAGIHLYFTTEIWMCLQCDAPCRGHLTKSFLLQIIRRPVCAKLVESRASLQSSHGCKLNTIAWLVELTNVHVVFKRESLLGGLGKARFTVKEQTLNLAESSQVILVTIVE